MMKIKEKLLIGLLGLKEIAARQDVEISALMHAGKDRKPGGLQDEFSEMHKTRELIEGIEDLLSNPILEAHELVITKIEED